MATVIPLPKLKPPKRFSFNGDIYDVFQEEDIWESHSEKAFIGTISLPRGSTASKKELDARRGEILEKLKAKLPEDQYAAFAKVLKRYDWNLSFLVVMDA